MLFEFNLPLRSNGFIAPEENVEYVYTVQPNCDINNNWEQYQMCISQMGRPYDDIFHPETAARWGYTEKFKSWFPTEFEYCLSRRGFTWDGWFRGVWYYHFKTGSHLMMDENAPAVHGTIKVVHKTPEDVYCLTWDLLDDAEEQNEIKGTWEGKLKRVVSLD